MVSQGQLEANKHFLARVEDKQTIKCSTPLLFFKQIRKRLGPDLARISFPTASFQEAVLGGGLEDLGGINVTAPAAGLHQHILKINSVSAL